MSRALEFVRTLHYTPSHFTFRIFLAVLERLFFHMNFGVRSRSSPIRILLSLIYLSKTVTVSIQDIFPEGKNHQLESSGSQLGNVWTKFRSSLLGWHLAHRGWDQAAATETYPVPRVVAPHWRSLASDACTLAFC